MSQPNSPHALTEASVLKRNRDCEDNNETLDNLWDWFNKSLDADLDRELIFMKMVNLVQKPYKEKIVDSTNANPSRSITPFLPRSLLPRESCPSTPETTEYAPSESSSDALTQVDETDADNDSTHQYTAISSDIVLVIPRVVLVGAGGKFVRIDDCPPTIQETNTKCAGTLSVTDTICPKTLFELHCFKDGTCAFKSCEHGNVYLAAYDSEVKSPNSFLDSVLVGYLGGTGGVILVNGLNGKEALFKIHHISSKSTKVHIESAGLPGRYLRLREGRPGCLDLKNWKGQGETFSIMVSPP